MKRLALILILLAPFCLRAQNTVPPGLTALGDSVTVGLGGSPDYFDLMSPTFGGSATNDGNSGDQVADMTTNKVYATSGLWNTAGTSTDKTLMIGLNDADFYGVGTNVEAVYTRSLQADIALLAIPRANLTFGTDAGCVKTSGTWVTQTVPNANGMGVVSSTNGSVLTCTVTTNSKGVLYVAYGALDHNAGTVSVTIDGVTPGNDATLLGSAPGGGNHITTQNSTPYTVFLARYSGLSAASHTVVFTVTSATDGSTPSAHQNTIYWLGGPFTVTPQNATIYAGGVTYQNGNANGTATAAYNTDAQTAISQLASDGLPVVFVNIRNYLNSSTDYAGGTPVAPSMPSAARTPGTLITSCASSNDLPFHPGPCGHAHLAEAFIAAHNSIGQVAAITGPTCGNFHDFAPSNVAAHYAASSESEYDGSQTAPPGSIGGTLADSTYGCTIKRMTNAPVVPANGNFCAHEYSNMSAVNADDSLVLMSCNSYFLADLSGNVIIPRGNLPFGGGIGSRWDTTNPKVLYYIVNPASGNVLFKGTIPSNAGACAPTCTLSSTTLHTFSEYTNINWGGGEGDLFSPDHILINGTKVSDGTVDIFVYTISTDTKGPVFNLGVHGMDNAQLTGSNQMVVNWGTDQSPLGSCSSGPCFTGFELFGAACNGVGCSPANGSYVRHLSDTRSHSIETRDNVGNDIVVAFDAYPRTPGCDNGSGEGGMVTIRVDGSGITCVLRGLPWNSTAHIAATKNLSGNNWILVSGEDSSGFGGNASGAATYPLNTNWNLTTNASNTPTSAGQWGFLTNDSTMISADGASFYRMYQSRSRPGTSDYWKSQRSCLSRDGAYVIYDSDFGQGQNFSGISDYIDVFSIATGIPPATFASGGMSVVGGMKVSGGVVTQ